MSEVNTKDYLTSTYLEYQKKYLDNIRESDRLLIAEVKELALNINKKTCSLIDIGCSTGNFLFHLKKAFPHFDLMGGDAFGEIVENCRRNPLLTGIDFDVVNIHQTPHDKAFDFVTLNALLHLVETKDLDSVAENLSRILFPKGYLLAFSWFNPFDQEISLVETSPAHPEGAAINVHSYATITEVLEKQGFDHIVFKPFEIPIDLAGGEDKSSLSSYTRKNSEGKRQLFRGSLYQPWCFLTARKK